MSRHTPRIKSRHLERESMVSHYRILKGYTEVELASLLGVSQAAVNALSLGVRAPIYLDKKKNGAIRREVLEMATVLDVSVAKLFPAYICDVDTRDIIDDTLLDISMGQWSITAGDACKELFEDCVNTKKKVWEAMRRLTAKQKIVLLRRIVDNEPLSSIAKTEELSIECVRQIEKKALRRMHWYLSRVLKEEETE